ncbi:hypothetical protein FQN57_000074 [Myotisia sp. PD_48]|nr:hypothetical protein FQN57_000074 [Myotisia sp. PD_48]
MLSLSDGRNQQQEKEEEKEEELEEVQEEEGKTEAESEARRAPPPPPSAIMTGTSSSPHSIRSSPIKSKQKFKLDPLEEAGFVSKGDTKLLDVKAQETYYRIIVERYMKFCSDYSSDLNAAFDSLPKNPSEDSTKNPPVPAVPKPVPTSSRHSTSQPASRLQASARPLNLNDAAAKDLSTLLLSLRKLREGVVATASKSPVAFAQQVHMFCVRAGLLARHPPSYYPPLKRLLQVLHTPSNPLAESELHEFTTYLILDYACRQSNFAAAFDLRRVSKKEFDFHNPTLDQILSSLMRDNWICFWKVRMTVDGYTRSLMNWSVGYVRRRTLKTIARAYLSVDVSYIIECCTGKKDGCTWEDLVEQEGLGWRKEGNKVMIRVMKPPTTTLGTPVPTASAK